MKAGSLTLWLGMVFVLTGCSIIEPGPGGPDSPVPEPEPDQVLEAPVIGVITDNADGYADFEASVIISNADHTASQEWSTNQGSNWVSGDRLQIFAPVDIIARSLATNGEYSPQSSAAVKFYQAPVFNSQWGGKGSSTGQLESPYGIAVGNGEVFVAEAGNHRIQVFDTNGNFLRMWGTRGTNDGELELPHSLFLTGELLYVADYGNHRIQVFDLQGNFIESWGEAGNGEGQFAHPQDIYVQNNEVYVTDFLHHQVQVFDTNGSFLRSWGGLGSENGEFFYVTGVWIRNGRVFVGDRINHRVQIFDTAGNHLDNITGMSSPLDLAIHHGRVYVTRYDNVISVTSSEGIPLTAWGEPGSEPGQLNYPAGIAFGENEAYVLDTKNHRVQKYVFE